MASSVRSLFFGSKLRIAATVLVLIVALFAVAFAAGVFGAPSVAGVDNRFGSVNESTTMVHTDLVVNNPNPVGVQLGSVSVEYGVTMNGVVMGNGTKDDIALERGNSTVSFETPIHNDRIPAWWATHVQNGEHTTLTVDADVRSSFFDRSIDVPTMEREVSTDVSSAFNSTDTRPINIDREFVSGTVLYLNETRGSWGEATRSETPIHLELEVYNPRSIPIPVGELGYEIRMNGIDVGSGQSDQSVVVSPGSRETISTTAVIDNSQLDEWWVSHLRNDQVTELEIDVSTRLDLSSLGGESIDLEVDTITDTVETDVFGNEERGNVSVDSSLRPVTEPAAAAPVAVAG